MAMYFCSNCSLKHSVTDSEGTAVCPICKKDNFLRNSNGVQLNILTDGMTKRFQCIKCKATFTSKDTQPSCPNGCSNH